MKTKIFSILFCLCMLVGGIFLLFGCDKNGNSNGNYELSIENSENGSAEIIDRKEIDGVEWFQIKAVPDEGYYFLKWEIQEATFSQEVTTFIINQPRFSQQNARSVKPVFTNNIDDLIFYDVKIEVENDLEVEIDYLNYSNKQNPMFSAYIYQSNDIVLSELYYDSKELSGGWGGNRAIRITSPQILPYSPAFAFSAEIGQLESVTLKFTDMRERSLVTIKGKQDGEICDNITTTYQICEKDEVSTIIPNRFTRNNGYYENSQYIPSYAYLTGWENEQGKVISKNKLFDDIVQNNVTYYAIYEKADEIYTASNGVVYLFSQNQNGTLTLQAIEGNNQTVFDIPRTVNNKQVTGISNYILMGDRFSASPTITIPNTIVDFEPKTFANIKSGGDVTINFVGDKQNLDFEMFSNPNAYSLKFNFTENTISSIINNQLAKLVKNAFLDVEFMTSEHLGEGVLGHYEIGTKKICVLETDEYKISDLWVLAHEMRHFYQSVAIGEVASMGTDDLIVQPTSDEIGAWKYLEYTDSTEDYNKYWYNAKEIDAREYATNILEYKFAQAV